MGFNVALTVAKNVGWNGLVSSGHLAAGFAVATAINVIASRILKPKPQSTLDGCIRLFALTAGIAVTLHYAPQAALVSFTANQALKLVALNALLVLGSNYIFKPFTEPTLLITVGAMAGYFGAPFLAAFAGAGAAAGAWQANKPTTTQRTKPFGTG